MLGCFPAQSQHADSFTQRLSVTALSLLELRLESEDLMRNRRPVQQVCLTYFKEQPTLPSSPSSMTSVCSLSAE
ncbi:hypothetical protein NQZ68_014662 [Dissostichus eleginoides]|nr:hypothetical protein NQZ68_014662 [Dissostichus eleginoides]